VSFIHKKRPVLNRPFYLFYLDFIQIGNAFLP
jgi:hypothetical protein